MSIISRLIPESTRWLITKKRYEEARELINQAAKMNNKFVPERLLIVPNSDENQVKLLIYFQSIF